VTKKLGEILIENGVITEVQLKDALILQKNYNVPLGHILIEMKLATQEQIVEALSQQHGVPYVNLINYDIEAENVTLVPGKLVQRYNMVPFDRQNGRLCIAASNPSNIEGIDVVRKVTKCELTIYFAFEEDIKFVYNHFFGEKHLTDDIQMLGVGVPAAPKEVNTTVEETSVNDAPVVKLINTLFSNAFRNRASDIHIEPSDDQLRVRFRIDGALYETMKDVSLSYHAPIVSRIKVLANLDIAEKRIPQDGRVPIEVDNQKADLRVSIVPTTFGEKVVLRILYKQTQFLSLDGLGLMDKDLQDMEDILSFPNGLVYASGPTGSGKTTTLYAFLHKLNSVHKNLMTLEDPIEYIFPGITQVNVHPKVGLTFANGLRSFLRQDPDIIMVGETRDQETAQITVQAALTGHLVLSTIHTNDAVTVVTRLINMQIEPYLIASALVGVIAQRLVRKICSKCIEPLEISDKYRNMYSLGESHSYFHGKGCEFCHDTGYSGRIGIYEILKVNDEIREAIIAGASLATLRTLAVQNGMRQLFDSGLALVKNGITTVDELLTVTAFK
jgi:type IV pilus assembly protein PilB